MTEFVTLNDLASVDQELVLQARSATANAYAPYSGFAVGSAILGQNGIITSGANFENASYGLTICAEVSAIVSANALGNQDFAAIAVIGHKFWPSKDGSQVVTPCGRCRQIILEVSQLSRTDIRVISCSGDLRSIQVAPISELLPDSFGPANLGMVDAWPEMRAELVSTTNELTSEKLKKAG